MPGASAETLGPSYSWLAWSHTLEERNQESQWKPEALGSRHRDSAVALAVLAGAVVTKYPRLGGTNSRCSFLIVRCMEVKVKMLA